MKNKNITTVVVEGTDGVGKSELIKQLFKIYNYKYMCYHRGELSDLVYSLKYNRPIYIGQNNSSIIYILLTCGKEELEKRIRSRNYKDEKELNDEIAKIDDQETFIYYAFKLKDRYNMFLLDTTGKSIEQVGIEASHIIDDYINKLNSDEELSQWNEMYKKGANKLGLDFKSIDNQPYINNIQFIGELNLHNGYFEKFTDKRYPTNLIFSYAYDVKDNRKFDDKKIDFQYIINSKIKDRPEIKEYFDNFKINNKTCLTGESNPYVDNVYILPLKRCFGDEFIYKTGQAKATLYCAREIAFLEFQTARLYEGILANNIVFIDNYTDPLMKIGKSIYGEDKKLLDLIYVYPETICKNYDEILKNNLYDVIIKKQSEYLNKLFIDLKDKNKNLFFNKK